MRTEKQANADGQKLAYYLEHDFDYRLQAYSQRPALFRFQAPDESLFCVIVSPNNDARYPSIDGWIEHWSWVPRDSQQVDRPVDYERRHDRIMW